LFQLIFDIYETQNVTHVGIHFSCFLNADHVSLSQSCIPLLLPFLVIMM